MAKENWCTKKKKNIYIRWNPGFRGQAEGCDIQDISLEGNVALEMAQWVVTLLCNHKNWSLYPQDTHKKLVVFVQCVCNLGLETLR